jgi:hypothetical protein
MRNMFRNETVFTKIELLVPNIWMCLGHGEGEEEIANHGWSRVGSFSQETNAIGQRTSRIDEHEPKLNVHRKMGSSEISAGCTDSRTQLPFFFSSRDAGHAQ